ncbi:MAG TPA: 50S ribosomal protein L11 methyltransferase [Gaiellaceae bacterium]|nr:50S ribosomal protein L11 methyltransferase [Gaiellaceae bacterium]
MRSGSPLRRVSVTVPGRRAEEARALMLELFPEGFEERDVGDDLELAAYTNAGGEERLSVAFGGTRTAEVHDGWADRWRDYHRPVVVEPLWVGPPWHEPDHGLVPVVIDPGRAFGTGAHATTRLCLELLIGLEPTSVVDIGCGSGVLAVAAAKLGFAPVTAVDFDSAAVDATRRNADRNGADLTVLQADAAAEDLPDADVVVANISLEAVERIVPRTRGGTALTSGYLESELPNLPGFAHAARSATEGWAADRFERE